MKYTYAEFLDILDWELQQEKQGGDSAQADKFRFLPHTQALRVINETIRELAVISQDQFEREYNYTVTVDGTKHIQLPEFIIKAIAYWHSTDECWKILGDSSDLTSELVSIDSATIYNASGWAEGDVVKLKVIAFPHEVIAEEESVSYDSYENNTITLNYGDSGESLMAGQKLTILDASASRYEDFLIDQRDYQVVAKLFLNKEIKANPIPPAAITNSSNIIPIPTAYSRLLILEIKRKVYARKGKAISTYEYSELMKLKAQWTEETSPIQHKARIAFEGYGLGR